MESEPMLAPGTVIELDRVSALTEGGDLVWLTGAFMLLERRMYVEPRPDGYPGAFHWAVMRKQKRLSPRSWFGIKQLWLVDEDVLSKLDRSGQVR